MASFPIHVVDDDRAVCTSLVRLLRACGLDAIGHTSPPDFLVVVRDETRGCAILDYDMPDMNGREVQRRLGAGWQVIFLSGEVDVRVTVEAMKSGAVDVLVKPTPGGALVATVRTALDRLRASTLEHAERAEAVARVDSLTPREREVMTHVIAGRLNKQIAHDLGTSERTVKHHRAAVMRKLGVQSVADLVRFAEKAAIAPV